MKKRSLLLFSTFLLCLPAIFSQEVIPLYDGIPPGSENWDWSEQISTKNAFNTEVVYNVVQPTLTAYLPPYYLATGTAVIVAPGGAFHTLSINSEGKDVAKWLNSKGIAAFVLKYRVARSYTDDPVRELMGKMGDFAKLDAENAPIIPLAMADGLAAVQYVRDHAEALEVDPAKIGFMGFSAGGTLAMSVMYNATDSNRPNFIAPFYAYEPAIISDQLPPEKTPIFVAAASDDQLGMVPYSLNIYEKWFDAGHPAELHLFEKGGHGFGMRRQNLPTDKWPDRFWDWLKLHGYNKKLYPSKYEKLYGEEAVEMGQLQEGERFRRDFGNLERYQADNRALPPPAEGEQRVVFLGNSITEGWVRADSAFFQDNNYVGRGIGGQTSAQLLLRFQQDVVALQPEAVLLHIGTNDVAENTGPYDPDFTMGNIRSMVEIARANGIKVLLASVLPATRFEWRRELGDRSEMIVDLNRRIKAFAAEHDIPYVDYHTATKNKENGMDPELAADGVHPTLKGYRIMERLARQAIRDLLRQ
ncbi:GDSL-type esterase/lipase family protein [Flavilitoribacter nigricans]|uniref:G-D-S-L family lipolytic protein n=1 Tax=Flavilitoribacter nigricans (strain ATCC 23147 / DSM 23189 / NBRC 102662 / NCIMB 1420 / SS-2) TaxID=1122177 RepID=A0A2D0N242_FLAN2|nr:GDSL-type esterase/lipase family protein [Flavilitoribacter nigricans]PHN02480.1 G-D-S-L family lipolytic protein [Flavilitoribacter nigricans DSM 23189 = NBRC 102662]